MGFFLKTRIWGHDLICTYPSPLVPLFLSLAVVLSTCKLGGLSLHLFPRSLPYLLLRYDPHLDKIHFSFCSTASHVPFSFFFFFFVFRIHMLKAITSGFTDSPFYCTMARFRKLPGYNSVFPNCLCLELGTNFSSESSL